MKMPKPMKASKVAEIRMKAISDKYMGTLLRELAFFVFYIAMLFLVSAGKDCLRWNGEGSHEPKILRWPIRVTATV